MWYEAVQIDFRAKETLVEQLTAQIRREILAGHLSVEEQFPTVRILAQQLKINFNTVARAYRALELEGYLSTVRGRGTFVLAAPAAVDRAEPLILSSQTEDEIVASPQTGLLESARSQSMPEDRPRTSHLPMQNESSDGLPALKTGAQLADLLARARKDAEAAGIPAQMFEAYLRLAVCAGQDPEPDPKRHSQRASRYTRRPHPHHARRRTGFAFRPLVLAQSLPARALRPQRDGRRRR